MAITLHYSPFAFILFVCCLCAASALIRLASATSSVGNVFSGSLSTPFSEAQELKGSPGVDMREANSTGLDCEIRSCTRCAAVLAAHPENPPTAMRSVVSRPVLSPPMRAPLMLIGQAPGLTEYTTGRPFSGQAGDAIRQLFSSCGVPFMDFDRLVYQTSAVKCFPGRRKNRERWEDRPPCTTMLRHCSDFLARQIEEMQPKIIVTLGNVAAKALDKLRGLPSRPLKDVAGTTEHWGGTVIIFLAHTSGGSFFLNDENNKLKQERGKVAIASAVQSLRQRRD